MTSHRWDSVPKGTFTYSQGKGALFCVLDDRKMLKEAVSDFGDQRRANHLLRRSLVGLDVRDWEDRQVITSASSTDGATLLTQKGRIADIACMIQNASKEQIQSAGFESHLDSIEHESEHNPLMKKPPRHIDFMFGDVGMIYVFYCFDCMELQSLQQCY